MGKLIGYIIALAGLVIIGLNMANVIPKIPGNIPYVLIIGAGLVIAGVFMTFGGNKSSSRDAKQAEEEVPIYEGEGKKRRIVGYKRAK